ncbi:hypothetical protein D046_3888B, partial [Vibrio parahaemolyticus V-223/04]
NLVMKLRR